MSLKIYMKLKNTHPRGVNLPRIASFHLGVNEEIKNLSYISHLSRDWSRRRSSPRKIPVMNACKSMCTCMCTHAYTHMCTHTHAHIHTRTCGRVPKRIELARMQLVALPRANRRNELSGPRSITRVYATTHTPARTFTFTPAASPTLRPFASLYSLNPNDPQDHHR